ncbi:MAG: type II toxin-antitoxin system VapC family toxin [Candidatus Binataceae bacterium]
MILYLDTSALVKLYATEPGSVQTRRAVNRADQVASSLLAYVETRAAFARKKRMRQLSDAQLERSKRAFERDWHGFVRLPADIETVRRAGDLAEQFQLRGYDALHLATADLLSRQTGTHISFLGFDAALNDAASKLGLTLLSVA